jgi:hypothetical protein
LGLPWVTIYANFPLWLATAGNQKCFNAGLFRLSGVWAGESDCVDSKANLHRRQREVAQPWGLVQRLVQAVAVRQVLSPAREQGGQPQGLVQPAAQELEFPVSTVIRVWVRNHSPPKEHHLQHWVEEVPPKRVLGGLPA